MYWCCICVTIGFFMSLCVVFNRLVGMKGVFIKYWICVYLFLSIVIGCTQTVYSKEVTVAVSSNMQYAFDDIKRLYEENTENRLRVVVGSSGQLTAQIFHGAPYDVFISADTEYPQVLFDRGYSVGVPKVYGYGLLVLGGIKQSKVSYNVKNLSDEAVKKIVIADPELAPYGKSTVQALMRAGVYKQIFHKLVYAPSAAQINHYLLSGNATVGFMPQSMALGLKQNIQWEFVDSNLYDPIAQSAVLLKFQQNMKKRRRKNFTSFSFLIMSRDIGALGVSFTMNILNGIISQITSSNQMSLVCVNVLDEKFYVVLLETPKVCLDLKVKRKVSLLFKETEIILHENSCGKNTLLNCAKGKVSEVVKGLVLTEITIGYHDQSLIALIPTLAVGQMELKVWRGYLLVGEGE